MKRGWRDLQAFVDPSWLDASSNDDRADTGVSGYASSTKLRRVACRTTNDRAVQRASRQAHLGRVLSRLDVDQPAPSGGVSSTNASLTQSAFLIWSPPTLIPQLRSMSISASPGWIMQVQVPRTDEWLRLSTSFSFAFLGTESL
jgi:hypothetical protein